MHNISQQQAMSWPFVIPVREKSPEIGAMKFFLCSGEAQRGGDVVDAVK